MLDKSFFAVCFRKITMRNYLTVCYFNAPRSDDIHSHCQKKDSKHGVKYL